MLLRRFYVQENEKGLCLLYVSDAFLFTADSIYLSSRTQAEEEQRTQDRHHASCQHEEPRRLKGWETSSIKPFAFDRLHSILSTPLLFLTGLVLEI
jgi:hypothetical protein